MRTLAKYGEHKRVRKVCPVCKKRYWAIRSGVWDEQFGLGQVDTDYMCAECTDKYEEFVTNERETRGC